MKLVRTVTVTQVRREIVVTLAGEPAREGRVARESWLATVLRRFGPQRSRKNAVLIGEKHE